MGIFGVVKTRFTTPVQFYAVTFLAYCADPRSDPTHSCISPATHRTHAVRDLSVERSEVGREDLIRQPFRMRLRLRS